MKNAEGAHVNHPVYKKRTRCANARKADKVIRQIVGVLGIERYN